MRKQLLGVISSKDVEETFAAPKGDSKEKINQRILLVVYEYILKRITIWCDRS